ncbi:TetR-like C-terminal domain-containing protein [Streptomyces sp. NPDC001982]|uniref:TetR-like C-terminal domain-containing protein n=1 Tax=Streptomyces sp. NPDC001982 TaxID=3154405 RepID=UPI00332CC66D
MWQLYRDTVILVRRPQVLEVLQRGIDTGEIRGDVDLELLGDLIVGPMPSRAMLRPGSSLEEGLSEQMVDKVLEGVRPRG